MTLEEETRVKKLVLVLATSTSMTDTRKGTLECLPCIHYPIQFKDSNKTPLQALIDSKSEVNAIHLSFARQLGLCIKPSDVRAQKIDGTTLDTHEIVIATFSVMDKAKQVRFFEKTFLVANVSPEIVFEMLFLTWSGVNINFSGRQLRSRTYIIEKALPIARPIELVGKKEFAAAALDLEHETYLVHVASLSSTLFASFEPILLNIHAFQRPQISGLIVKKAPMMVPAKYSDFADVFSPDLASELLEYSKINNNAIKLVESCQ